MISRVTIIVMMIIAIFFIVSIQVQKQQQTALAFHAFNAQWGFTDRGFKQLIKEDPRSESIKRDTKL
jgi:L-asparagine transporter-like permease